METPNDPTGLRYYGSDMTIHQTNGVDVELDEHGGVVAVWFRCQMLPFTQSTVSEYRANDMRNMYKHPMPGIEAVVLREER